MGGRPFKRFTSNARKYFFLALLVEGYHWREALNKTIKIVGVNEYAQMVGEIKPSNLLNQLKPTANITVNTLNRVTKPLGIIMTFKDKSVA